ALLPIALDLLVLDEPLDQRERIGRIRQERLRALRRDRGGASGKAFPDIDPAADRAAIARRSADAERPPLEDDRVDPVPRQFERRGKPGIAAADNRDPRLVRHIDELA